MFKLESRIGELIERLQQVQHDFQHGILAELDDQQKHIHQIQKKVQKNIGRQSRRIGGRVGNQVHQVQKRFEDTELDTRGVALTLGLLTLGGLAYFGYFGLRTARIRSEAKKSLTCVPGLDLGRFAGKWFEIARLPGKHQNVAGMTLTYTLNADNSLDVVCSYHDHDLDGPEHVEKKHIRIAEPDNRSHMKKQVFGPLSTDYWVIEVGKNYEYAVLATPSRKHLWILCRSPKIDEKRYQEIVGRMKEMGFETDKLIRLQHEDHAPVALSSHLQALLDQKQQYFKGEEPEKHRGPQEKHRTQQEKSIKPHHEKREEI
ncbi:MAG: lipocalin family protein [Candidatus Sericytochromatia bacterium]